MSHGLTINSDIRKELILTLQNIADIRMKNLYIQIPLMTILMGKNNIENAASVIIGEMQIVHWSQQYTNKFRFRDHRDCIRHLI